MKYPVVCIMDDGRKAVLKIEAKSYSDACRIAYENPEVIHVNNCDREDW